MFGGDKRTHDDAFDARVDLVCGLLEQSQDAQAQAICLQLRQLKNKASLTRADFQALQENEAKAYVYADKESLAGIYFRLRDRSYRLPKSVRDGWTKKLDPVLTGKEPLTDEVAGPARRLLAQLAREITFETAEWVRRTSERAKVLLGLNVLAFAFVSILVYECVQNVAQASKEDYLKTLLPVALAGGIGAGISAIRGMRQERQLRVEYLLPLSVQLFVRTLLGLFYASFVVTCVWTNVLPLKVPEKQEIPFYLVVGFVSGFSDTLFGQAVGRFVNRGEGSDQE
jgi:hypothetical protein